jgi:hypothetical protein
VRHASVTWFDKLGVDIGFEVVARARLFLDVVCGFVKGTRFPNLGNAIAAMAMEG